MGAHTFWLSLVTSYICQHYTQVHFRCKTSLRLAGGVGGSIYDSAWSAAKWTKQRWLTAVATSSNYFSVSPTWPVCLVCRFSRAEQTQKRYMRSLCRLALTVGESASKWEANGTDSHKMETPLGRQTLYRDNCYLITRGKRSHGSPFFSYCINTLGKQIFQWLPSPRFNPYGAFRVSPRMLHSPDGFSE